MTASRRNRALGAFVCLVVLGFGLAAGGVRVPLVGSSTLAGRSSNVVPAGALSIPPASSDEELAGGGVEARVDRRAARFAAGGQRFSLSATGIGRAGRLLPAPARRVRAHGNRIAVTAPGLTEWFTAEPVGIEQGFTVGRRPSGREGSFEIAIALRGAAARRSGAGIAFEYGGRVVASYGALSAVDATGRRLPADVRVARGRFELVISDRNARYPVTVDPLVNAGQLPSSPWQATRRRAPPSVPRSPSRATEAPRSPARRGTTRLPVLSW